MIVICKKYRLLVYFTSFTVCSGDIKKKALKMKKKTSENNQLTGHFQSFFFSVPPTLNLKKNPVNQVIIKIWPNVIHFQHAAFKWSPDTALKRDCTVMFDFIKLLSYEIIQ